MFGIIKELLGLGKTIAGSGSAGAEAAREAAKARGQIADAQASINQAEIGGAPVSVLRLWRSCLGWCLALCFIWEVAVRPVIYTYWPETVLPPSFIKEITSLLVGMLGLGI